MESVNTSFLCWLADTTKARMEEICWTTYILSANMYSLMEEFSLNNRAVNACQVESFRPTVFRLTDMQITFESPPDSLLKVSKNCWYDPNISNKALVLAGLDNSFNSDIPTFVTQSEI